MLRADILIIGAGPAGSTAALNLALEHRVLLVDRSAEPMQRIGESLPPAARRLITDMGLWEAFLAQGHAPCYGNRSIWGGLEAEQDFLRDPDGPGWHLDRARFESWLQAQAVERGAALLRQTTCSATQATEGGWRVMLQGMAGTYPVHAKVLIDAGGRNARLTKTLGARRIHQDKLICGWLYGQDHHPQGGGLSHIESSEHGWWYSAQLPGHRRVLAFHTDSDLPAARALRDGSWLAQAALALPGLGPRLHASGFIAESTMRVTAAHSAASSSVAGPGWFAVGDAALSFDPLSSQGLFNALYTGLAAAEACDRTIRGQDAAWKPYGEELGRIAHAYRHHLKFWYGQELRWADAPFWKRRICASSDQEKDSQTVFEAE
ncbi:NAD(P)/FAD-dependent oxidoreductase [Chromobacterium haemolyticum]|uniref:NAD(P)/FAD-dependent oxidoreductase n=1 Tax=Chromobacterium haemolyticum TaxID=394935 RepID=A0ABS3GVQ2_9NEIS|nr:NAD(P)/FAD-dependent oxidoreductase [Chromobacterium haemolyticum]MBK0417218.1 NAD(P)/FAD-dependent oxidoreductase [Chromobacterium haemolyticum]MBO0418343.1 NAD(P)/FAD-dependent oxidoreductase [Chromobacterium haemolyticum]MBO0501668.1 NAD(P)/FAD-dependent oxidoreductase [Chromobacterium haemolyticum]